MDGISGGKKNAVGHASSFDHSRVQKSSTLSRRFVKRPKSNLAIAGSASAASESLRKQMQQQQQQQQQQRKIKSVAVASVQQSGSQVRQKKSILLQEILKIIYMKIKIILVIIYQNLRIIQEDIVIIIIILGITILIMIIRII